MGGSWDIVLSEWKYVMKIYAPCSRHPDMLYYESPRHPGFVASRLAVLWDTQTSRVRGIQTCCIMRHPDTGCQTKTKQKLRCHKNLHISTNKSNTVKQFFLVFINIFPKDWILPYVVVFSHSWCSRMRLDLDDHNFYCLPISACMGWQIGGLGSCQLQRTISMLSLYGSRALAEWFTTPETKTNCQIPL